MRTSGMVLKSFDYSEYDRRLVMLTLDAGKVTVFARGVRRQNSRFMGACEPFSYGEFSLFPGKEAYNLSDAEISNHFEDLRMDMEKMCYASYFSDLADYSTRENMDARNVLMLLYRSFQALNTDSIENRLVRAVFELRMVMENGVYPGVREGTVSDGARSAMEHIEKSGIRELYSFKVRDDIREEIIRCADEYRRRYMQGRFRSLEVMEEMGYNI